MKYLPWFLAHSGHLGMLAISQLLLVGSAFIKTQIENPTAILREPVGLNSTMSLNV